MEPTKQAALMVCLKKLQVDLAENEYEKEWQIERAEKAEAEVNMLRSVVETSGLDSMRRLMELGQRILVLESTNQRQQDFIQSQAEVWGENIRLENQCRSLRQGSEMFKRLWCESRANLVRSQRRCKVLLAWVRKSLKVRTLSRGRQVLVNMKLKTRKR